MRYFSYDLIAAANDWNPQTKADQARAEKQFAKAVERYCTALDKLRSRIGRRAWQFFRHGFGPTGLHDGRLVSISIGDGLDYVADGTKPFRINRQRLVARLEFLNYEQEFYYVFELRGVTWVRTNLFPDEWAQKSAGDLYTYEIVSIDDDCLQLAFLFESGATIIVRFRKLLFRRRRTNRQYAIGEMYR